MQDARFQQLLEDYLNTVLNAQGDTENAIIGYLSAQEQLNSYQLAEQASQRAVNAALVQYRQGEIPFSTVNTILASHVEQQDVLASTQGDVASNLVQVYRALGGGWEIRGEQSPAELLPEATKAQMRERTRAWKGVLK